MPLKLDILDVSFGLHHAYHLVDSLERVKLDFLDLEHSFPQQAQVEQILHETLHQAKLAQNQAELQLELLGKKRMPLQAAGGEELVHDHFDHEIGGLQRGSQLMADR